MKSDRELTMIHPQPGDELLVSKKTGRNALCPCGSGRKAKKCCGAETKYLSVKATGYDKRSAKPGK